jgi:hypothetical protein
VGLLSTIAEYTRLRRRALRAVGTGVVGMLVLLGSISCATDSGGTGGTGQGATSQASSDARPATTTDSGDTGDTGGGTGAAQDVPESVPDDWPRWGITHTQYSADSGDERLSDDAIGLLGRIPMMQNQHIMGFGVDNPEPSPGQYKWDGLDSRMTVIDRSGGLPVITLCCAPDWMKGGSPGQTDWDKLTVAPTPDHFDDFADLAAEVAKRYPQVQYYMVWNEFKGFWPNTDSAADAKGYTDLYNKVYTKLKAVNPDIRVGGPYIPINSHKSRGGSDLKGDWGVADEHSLDAVEYWLKHKKGADFIVVDGASVTEEHQTPPNEFGALGKFAAVTKWLRDKSGGLPVWWAEWYIEPENIHWDEPHRLAVRAVSMMEFAQSGATTALYWSPQTPKGEDCRGCLWNPADGSPQPTLDLIDGFVNWFPAHVKLERVTSSNPKVRVLAQKRQLLMVNTANAPVSATVDGQKVQLQPYEVKWRKRAA